MLRAVKRIETILRLAQEFFRLSMLRAVKRIETSAPSSRHQSRCPKGLSMLRAVKRIETKEMFLLSPRVSLGMLRAVKRIETWVPVLADLRRKV